MLYALLGAVAIGLVLGLLGSGGSILTVPVLVYLAGQPDKVAIAESLAIVGAIAAVGAVPYARQKLVDWHSVLYFGVPGIVGTYGGAALAKWVPGAVQLALFAVVMILAAGLMLRGKESLEARGDEPHTRQPLWLIAIEGLIVGVLTGLVGVGGGFLIVPALVLLGGLSMRMAVGTSLLIIAAKSAAGFWKYTDVLAETGLHVDWALIGIFAVIGIAGSFVGNALSQRVPQAQLKRGFAVFLVVMGIFILYKEAPAVFATTLLLP
ncbi:sulfite exporter TauE/SafE family protein [Rubrivirga sp. IMCC43871]|uniref:sulfite exporter TauE/SafE family protein n=1 Tax=Rubrivirga sp. IMCC43871 TaxID=3391575 RepID=UPI00399035EB